MKCGTALLLLASLARYALAEFSYTVTATHNGKPIDSSAIKLEPFVPHLHGVNQTSQDVSGPPGRPGRARRMQRALGTGTSANWCGAVAQTSGSTLINKAHGYFQAPTLSARSGVSSFPQYVGEWIGIDGYTNSVILQSGTGHSISSGGVQSNWAWFQWYPSAAYTITSFPVAAGDWIEVTITASSSTSGSITISNLSQSYTYTVNLSGGTALSRNSVEWVVEDPANGSGLLPFAAFSTVWFEDVHAQTSSNTYLGVDSSTLISINNGHCVPVEYDNDNFYAYSA